MSNPILILPFIFMLLAIAIGPLLKNKIWEEYYIPITITSSSIVLLYYLIIFKKFELVYNSIHEYLSFIILIGSLFVVSSGILLTLKGKSTPKNNVLFLFIGAIISNFIGTTGASILLIRPFIKVNRYRIKPFHIVFFIFIVSNVGGMLTPIGDPPLFLGYLKGIPFFWITEKLFLPWLFILSLILIVFYFIDRNEFLNHSKKIQSEAIKSGEEPEFKGKINIGFLSIIILATFVNKPIFLRELIMLFVAVSSYYFTNKTIHEKNEFSFLPIKEVAILFFGIFVTMIPAIEYVTANSKNFNLTTTTQFFWITGILSSLLDNAPTYLNSIALAFGIFGLDINKIKDVSEFLILHPKFVEVISFSAVSFGALTYIGNGPNFLVKIIAEHNKISMPSFFGYVFKYSILILLPIIFLTWILFY